MWMIEIGIKGLRGSFSILIGYNSREKFLFAYGWLFCVFFFYELLLF